MQAPVTYWYVLSQPNTAACVLSYLLGRPAVSPLVAFSFLPYSPISLFPFSWSHCHLQSEAIPESLKNMLLVMDTAEIFHSADARGGSPSALWEITWERIDCFLPHLRDELFKQTVIQGRGLRPTSSERVWS